MSMGAKIATEQAILVALIRGRIPKLVHLPNRYNQGVSTFEWNRELGQYVELISKEESEETRIWLQTRSHRRQ